MKYNPFKFFALEFRRIKWASRNKTLNSFVTTMITIVLFSVIIFLFSWGIIELISIL